MLYITNLQAYPVAVDALITIPAGATAFAVDDSNPDTAARVARLVNTGLIKVRGADSRYYMAGEALTKADIVTLKSTTTATTKCARNGSGVATLTVASHPFNAGESVLISGFVATANSTRVSRTDGVVTITFASHPFAVGDIVTVASFTDTTLNGEELEILTANATTVTYAKAGDDVADGAAVNGVVTATAGNKYLAFNGTVVLTSVTATTLVFASAGAAVTEAAYTSGRIQAVENATRVFRANATDATKPAEGFVKAAFGKGSFAQVFVKGVHDACADLTPGEMYWLSTTSGGITLTAPTTNGNIVQVVGVALSPTELEFDVNTFVTLA